MTTGYSGTPLVRKLGLKPRMECAVVDPPENYRDLLVGIPDDLRIAGLSPESDDYDFIHLFVRERDGLGARMKSLRGRIARDGMVWVSWPKKASGVETDVSGGVVRDAGLAAGLVDVKVCAVDETWSGLKFVIRRADRE